MDGIGTENSDIIMLASTNRADMLDKGNLLRGNDNFLSDVVQRTTSFSKKKFIISTLSIFFLFKF